MRRAAARPAAGSGSGRAVVKVLVAGMGNVLLGDDGFGVEVARRLTRGRLPAGVRVADYGVHGMRLGRELLHGYDLLILVDTLQRGGDPGTIYVIDAGGADGPRNGDTGGPAAIGEGDDGVSLDTVLSVLKALGGELARMIVVACEPANAEAGEGLTDPVARAVDRAVVVVRDLLAATPEPAE